MMRYFSFVFAGVCVLAGAAHADSLKIELPPETVKYKPGPHQDLAVARCSICHSADYVATQPPNLTRAAWTAEVNKMKKVYGAPIADEDVETLADYLVTQYGSDGAR